MNYVDEKDAPIQSPISSSRKPAERLRLEKEEQRRECAPTYKISRSKRYKACSDVARQKGIEPPASPLGEGPARLCRTLTTPRKPLQTLTFFKSHHSQFATFSC